MPVHALMFDQTVNIFIQMLITIDPIQNILNKITLKHYIPK